MNIFMDEKKIIIIGVLFLFVFFFASASFGATIDGGDTDAAYDSLNNFRTQMSTAVSNAMVSVQLNAATSILYAVFAITLIVFTMFRYAHGTAGYDEIIAMVLLIGMVGVLRVSYDTLTVGIWDWFDGLAQNIQLAFIGSTQPLEISLYITSIIDNITLISTNNSSSWFQLPTINVVGLFAMALFGFMALVVSIMSFFASAWALWGYALTKTIGWLLVPFLLFERLSFIFDGWLKMFLGFCFYSLLARVNLLLMAMALKSYFNILGPITKNAPIASMDITVDTFSDLSGIGSLIFIGVLALISTGQFATSLAGGAGGFGQALRSVTMPGKFLR